MAELYRRVEDDPKYGRPASVRHEPVGYTEDDVRRLAEWVRGAYPHVCFGTQPNALAPFRALLDGGKDNG